MKIKSFQKLAIPILLSAVLVLVILSLNSQTASAVGGAYSFTLAAADPEYYNPPIPYPANVTPIIGRGNGDASSTTIPGAWFTHPTTTVDVKIKSIEPQNSAHQLGVPVFTNRKP